MAKLLLRSSLSVKRHRSSPLGLRLTKGSQSPKVMIYPPLSPRLPLFDSNHEEPGAGTRLWTRPHTPALTQTARDLVGNFYSTLPREPSQRLAC